MHLKKSSCKITADEKVIDEEIERKQKEIANCKDIKKVLKELRTAGEDLKDRKKQHEELTEMLKKLEVEIPPIELKIRSLEKKAARVVDEISKFK